MSTERLQIQSPPDHAICRALLIAAVAEEKRRKGEGGPQWVRCGTATFAPAAPAPRPSLRNQFSSSGLCGCCKGEGGAGGMQAGWGPYGTTGVQSWCWLRWGGVEKCCVLDHEDGAVWQGGGCNMGPEGGGVPSVMHEWCAGYCFKTLGWGAGGGGLALALARPTPPMHPHQKTFLGEKRNVLQGPET